MLTEQQMAECVNEAAKVMRETRETHFPGVYDTTSEEASRLTMHAFLRSAEKRGFKLVGRDATAGMIVALMSSFQKSTSKYPGTPRMVKEAIAAMLDAAPGVGDIPQPPTGGPDE